MKKSGSLAAVVLLFLLTGCSATTITGQAGNYIYKAGEAIDIIDIDTRNTIGTLKLTGAEVLINEPFTVREKSGTDESGNDVYVDVTYAQLLQIDYVYENKNGNNKNLSSANFQIYGSDGSLGTVDPDAGYTPIEANGTDSFTVALQNKSESVSIHFRYNIWQTTITAKINLDVIIAASDQAVSASPPSDLSSSTETSASVSTVAADNVSSAVSDNRAENPFDKNILLFILIICFIAVISVIALLFFRKK